LGLDHVFTGSPLWEALLLNVIVDLASPSSDLLLKLVAETSVLASQRIVVVEEAGLDLLLVS
jgi:hypothetical protein